jgi:cell division protein DivIC
LKYLKNIYILILVVFVIWMVFFDTNSLIIHSQYNSEIDDLEAEKEYYKKEIEKDQEAIDELSREEGIETFAREQYYMKKDNEDIYIIEYQDSLKTKEDE